MNTNRELAAILFSDISGFTQTMDTDENLAMEQVLRHKEIITHSIKEHNGHLLKEMGDGLLIKFSSAIESVKCAIGIQEIMRTEKFSIRIGIHLGDIITKNSDIFGSGVNIASRIHTASSSGSICISKEIWLQIKNQSEIKTKSLGEQEIKGIKEKIEVFKLLTGDSSSYDPVIENQNYPFIKKIFLPATGLILTIIGGIFWVTYSFFNIGLSNSSFTTSIAILELINISSDSNSFFAEGLTEELISQLNRIKNLKVTPRTDVTRYKGKNIPIYEIGKELDVEYIVEGSVRISGDDLRVNATLFNVVKKPISIWSDKYDDQLKNIIQVQDKIASQIVSKLNATITKSPLSSDPIGRIHPIGRRLTKSLDAVSFVSYASAYLTDPNYSNFANAKAAIPFLNKAIEMDSTIGQTHALLALSKYILLEKTHHKVDKELKLLEINNSIETALRYDPYNKLAMVEKLELSPLILRADLINNNNFDVQQINEIGNNILKTSEYFWR